MLDQRRQDLDYHRRSLQADVHRDIQQGIDRGGPSL
jgi:hypothetical protein